MRALAASCLCLNGCVAPRGTQASAVPQARRDPWAFPETEAQREIVETPGLRGHLAWPLGRRAPLDLPAWLGNLESLVFLGSQAQLGVRGRQEGQEKGENQDRKESAASRAEMAFLASPDPPDPLAPRWPRTSQVLDRMGNKDSLDSRVLRGSQAVMVTEAPKETGVCQASRESRESLARGAKVASRVYRESAVWLGLKGSRVHKV